MDHDDNKEQFQLSHSFVSWINYKERKHSSLLPLRLSFQPGQGSPWSWHPCGVVLTQSFTPSFCIHESDSCAAFCVRMCVSSATVAYIQIDLRFRAKEHAQTVKDRKKNLLLPCASSLVHCEILISCFAGRQSNYYTTATNKLRKWVIAFRRATSESRDLQQIFTSAYVRG